MSIADIRAQRIERLVAEVRYLREAAKAADALAVEAESVIINLHDAGYRASARDLQKRINNYWAKRLKEQNK